jgi:hypothetical protein
MKFSLGANLSALPRIAYIDHSREGFSVEPRTDSCSAASAGFIRSRRRRGREATAPHLDSTAWCLPGCLNAKATVRRIAADLLQRHVGGLGLKPDIRVAQNLRRADFC